MTIWIAPVSLGEDRFDSSEGLLTKPAESAPPSDGTVVFTFASEVTGGSLRTIDFARKHGKPCIHIAQAGGHQDPALRLQRFAEKHGIRVLNVAGSRESKEPELHRWVMSVLEDAFFWSENHPGAVGGPGEG